jgi:hypothetical protein
MAVGASATYGGKRYSENVTARLYIGVHARVVDVTAAWVALWSSAMCACTKTPLRAAAFAWPLAAFTRLVELTSCFMARSICGMRRHPTLHLCWYESDSLTLFLGRGKNHSHQVGSSRECPAPKSVSGSLERLDRRRVPRLSAEG